MTDAGEIVDISMPMREGMLAWPGSPGLRVTRVASLAAGDAANSSCLTLDAHLGTHIDAPLHAFDGAGAVDNVPLGALVGPAWVSATGDADRITADVLARCGLPADATRLLLKTANSSGATRRGTFDPGYAGLTLDAAEWLVERGVRLIGTDYLSVQRYEDPRTTHEVLLRAGVVLLEGLDLSDAEPGGWELICLPLRLVGVEAAPARAILRRLPGG